MACGLLYLIHQDGTCIVPHNIHDSSSHPGPNCITIVKTRNCGGDKALRAELRSSRNTNLCKPSLIPCDFIVHVEVCRVVLVFVRECVGDMGKGIEVRSGCPPCLQFIQVCTFCGIWIFGRGGWPEIHSGSERLLKLERSIDLIWVFDWANTACSSGGINVVRILRHFSIRLMRFGLEYKYLDITIAVVTNFHEVIRTCG